MPDAQDLETRVALLETRLRITEDIAAIQQLKARYGEITDARYALFDRSGAVLPTGWPGSKTTPTCASMASGCTAE